MKAKIGYSGSNSFCNITYIYNNGTAEQLAPTKLQHFQVSNLLGKLNPNHATMTMTR